eukprot:CAMPEP_0184326252 /NCGR_PEP_ID=MMETSP1049-20130417/142465_1 /TAXON_ID=77928 /ORGANISM="Proteomonas sulcata, Strain CCMP704" /LENGTH=103 /DNA_ID=CAMNT_0026648435 /DNA_START=186 /DNA_END=497 /DNA_ORIENTATION=-
MTNLKKQPCFKRVKLGSPETSSLSPKPGRSGMPHCCPRRSMQTVPHHDSSSGLLGDLELQEDEASGIFGDGILECYNYGGWRGRQTNTDLLQEQKGSCKQEQG